MKKQICKIILSGFLAFVFLNIICFFFYNVPPRKDTLDGSTDYKWPENSFYSAATEGVAWGQMNNDGYNNLLDYDSSVLIDGLVMGDSHLEGRNISQKENLVSILNTLSNEYFYNIGVSEHTLPISISNLENAISKYNPKKYIIIETMNISFYDNELVGSLSKRTKLPTYSGMIMDVLQNMKYLKLIRYQLVDTNLSNKIEPITSEQKLKQMLEKASTICKKNNLKLIIVFHPNFTVSNDKKVIFNYSDADCELFKKVSEEYNITFVNMKEDFIKEYKDHNIIPYGFNNTVIGTGHLNKYGHNIIAKRIMETINNDN